MSRVLDVRVTAARDEGFVVMEDGEAVAAFETPAAAAMWLENRLRLVDGASPSDRLDVQGPTTYPNVIQAADARKRSVLWGRIKG